MMKKLTLIALFILVAATLVSVTVNVDSLQALAEQGNKDATFQLGEYWYGRAKAAESYLWKISISSTIPEKGAPDFEQLRLEAEKDYQEAYNWLSKVATDEYPKAYQYLGMILSSFYYQTRDSTEAFNYFQKAAKFNLSQAQLRLGLIYKLGTGVAVNVPEAIKWLTLAAEQGETLAMVHLEHLYNSGKIITRNPQEAWFWNYIMMAYGFPNQRGCQQLAKELTPEQLAEVKQRAEIWLSEHPKKQKPIQN